MDTEMMEMFQTILTGMQDMENRINAKIEGLDKKIDTEISSVKVMIENDVTKRLDSLFDGYQSVHEKQFVQEQEIKSLERRVDTLEVKVG